MMLRLEKNKSTLVKNTLFQNQTFKVDYAIISAMSEELEFFQKEFSSLKYNECKIGDLVFKIYNYKNHKILITSSGMGTAFAAAILTLINSYFKPEYFLISGTAGGIKKDLHLRDVVIAEKAFEAEIQDAFKLLKNTPFESCLKHPVKNKYFPAHYSADPELLKICDTLDIPNLNIQKGTVVSSNAFPAPKELFEKIKSFNPCSIDMETSAFYQTAWLLNLKVLAVRGTSNILNSDGSDENIMESDVAGSSLAAATVLFSILEKSISLKNQAKLSPRTKLEGEALQLATLYDLQPHPEGGYFAPVFKSNDMVKPCDAERYNNENRSASTSIYYLLNGTDYSAWHTLKSDELWHFYRGSTLNIYVIDKAGNFSHCLLGDPIESPGAVSQFSIKAGSYFAAENADQNSYSLVGCTVSPGFEYSDFKLANKNELINIFPQHEKMIARLIHPSMNSSPEIIADHPKGKLFLG